MIRLYSIVQYSTVSHHQSNPLVEKNGLIHAPCIQPPHCPTHVQKSINSLEELVLSCFNERSEPGDLADCKPWRISNVLFVAYCICTLSLGASLAFEVAELISKSAYYLCMVYQSSQPNRATRATHRVFDERSEPGDLAGCSYCGLVMCWDCICTLSASCAIVAAYVSVGRGSGD